MLTDWHEEPQPDDELFRTIRLAELLMNAGLFFDAHEYVEGVWRTAAGETREFLKGLIQVAAALHKLEREKWLRAEWGVNDTGRRAKFYTLTPLGKRKLQAEVARWQRSSQAVSTVLDVTEA